MKWVLIIEPSRAEREYLERIVTRLGYRLFPAETGLQGLYYARQSLPDAVIIGEGLRDFSPMELGRIFMEDSSLSTAPMLHISTRKDSAYTEDALRAGYADVVHRPMPIRQFYRSLERCLSSTRMDIRVPMSVPVQLSGDGDRSSLWSFNIGEGGLYLKTLAPLPPETELGVSFRLPGLRKTFDFTGSVVHAALGDSEGLPAGMGVRFTNITRTIRTILGMYMEYHLTSAELPAR